MPNFNTNDILIAEANLLYAPTGTALPDETTVAWNTYDSWTDWVHLGYTDSVSNVTYSYNEMAYTPEQALSPVVRRKIDETMEFSFSLSQLSAAHLALLTSGTATATAAGASQKGFTEVVAGGDTQITQYMFALEGYRIDSAGDKQPVRLFVHKASIMLNGQIPFGKSAAATVPVTVKADTDATQTVGEQLFVAHFVTAPATA